MSERQPDRTPEITYGNVEPITPQEVVSRKKEIIPDVVFEVFNELIARNASRGGYSRFLQKDVEVLLVERGVPLSEAYEKHWLDVEEIYTHQGWDVEYDKPAYNESYEPNFIFKPKEKSPIQ
jgi:hypothetical protein